MTPFPHLFRALPLVLLLAPGAAQADPQVRAVTLSTAGTALVETTLPMTEGQAGLTLRRADLDGFLKSVVVGDPAGSVIRLRLPGPAAFEDAFAALPLAPADLQGKAALLSAMTGAAVTVDRRGVETRGTVMGVTDRPCEHGPCAVLTLRDDTGALRALDLDGTLDLRFDDPADRAMIDAGLAALRLGRDPRRVAVALGSDDDTTRDLSLRWLQPAPVWKTAWRAVDTDDGLALTGWAVLENTTGQDWDAVELTLATGAVQVLEAALYARDHADAFAAPAMESALMARSMADQAVADTLADDGASFSRFTLATPVTLAAGQMISLPFLQDNMPQAQLLVHRGGQGASHPRIALSLHNPLPLRLPGGVMTYYQDGRGHAGDAQVPELAPGGAALLEFARDTSLRVAEDVARTETLRSLTIADGVVTLTEDLMRRTTYRIEADGDAARDLTLDHPRQSGWELATGGAESRLEAHRFTVAVAPDGITEFTVTERQPRSRRIAVTDIDDSLLDLWMRDAPDAETEALLSDLAALRRDLAQARRDRAAAEAEAEDLAAEQARLVDLIVALGSDSAADRDRRARVDALDARIFAARTARRAAEARAAALEARIAELIGG
ncbi:hypothetical protein HUK65_15295 [Rhodobacteraceae bacterium 2376]|uniref:DUF4139 domain-containing protein n=1 Tax=Rhabdonatronobacter sediminivivens TaxID=2743469 RepID=A0A7Z0I1S5_9RHOB|nr:hypothetical protein [Rhabdonatronobacter sediminivivens]NYS26353.1 hypothetical protein [Rhabdonatronobacter sediminivivens]